MSSQTQLGSQPTPPPRRDLQDVFAPGATDLQLPRRVARDHAGQDKSPAPAPDGTDGQGRTEPVTVAGSAAADREGTAVGPGGPAAGAPARRGPGRPRTPVSAAADKTLTARRVVYVPDDVRDALAMACASTRGSTRTQVILEAIEAVHSQLGDLILADTAPQVIKGELWDEVVYPNRRRQPAKRQVFITPTVAQLAIIDSLVEKKGARDRSHLVVVALRAHLKSTPANQ